MGVAHDGFVSVIGAPYVDCLIAGFVVLHQAWAILIK